MAILSVSNTPVRESTATVRSPAATSARKRYIHHHKKQRESTYESLNAILSVSPYRKLWVSDDENSSASIGSSSGSIPFSPSAVKKEVSFLKEDNSEMGDGSTENPFRQMKRQRANKSGCIHCPNSHCCCLELQKMLEKNFAALSIKRITSTQNRMMCAKSVLPSFVSRLARILDIKNTDTFYDLGSGNGSVVFQVAYMIGCPCIGVELSEHNAELARQAWKILKPKLEKKSGRKMPEVTIITGDLLQEIKKPFFLSSSSVVWTANLLMPKMVTLLMSDRFRELPVGARIACFDDMYPHSRSVARIRDPERFALFEMKDYIWAIGSVEWTPIYEGRFYAYARKAVEE